MRELAQTAAKTMDLDRENGHEVAMQLTRHTDLALRLLIYLAEHGPERSLIAGVAEDQAISRTHLMKVANRLAHAGYIDAARGNGGGIRLAKPAAEINIGAVIAAMEPDCAMVDCNGCRLIRSCGLPGVLGRAKRAFLDELGRHSLADIMR